ncbi:DUF2092 domain-containing protein [Paraburkholderia sp. A1RI-2L]|uniref:DUF2092 domain-containing protein n=1 Tax=Paraburkholderia sp. A1RI-2L TaxID=3028367 RepID=UPI003B7C8613
MNKIVFPGVIARTFAVQLVSPICLALIGAVMLGGCAHQKVASKHEPVQSNVPSPLNDLGSGPGESSAAIIDARATSELDAMGRYLRSLRTFEVNANTATDVVLDNGQNVAFLHHTVLKVKRPDRLRADITGNGNVRGIVYDGHRFTIFNEKKGYYARHDAPPTLDALVHDLAANWHIETPLADLFYWGNGKPDNSAIQSAQTLGDEKIDARTCTHYAFREADVDWELWVQTGRRPLPCKMIVTDTTQPARPRHDVTYHWRLNPAFAASTFVFHPGPGARQIELKPADHSPYGEAE